MKARRVLRYVLLVVVVLTLGACASLSSRDPIQVSVAGIEALQGEGLELRLLVKLRVQNPNDDAIDYNGVYVKLDVQGRTFASGVSDQTGTVPRFGEAIVAVPVTVSVLRMARHVVGMLDGKPVDKIIYVLDGKLNSGGFYAVRFRSQGELKFPTGPIGPADSAGS